MKYFLACLIVPTTLVLLTAVFVFGALCFCVINLHERMVRLTNKISTDDADTLTDIKIHAG